MPLRSIFALLNAGQQAQRGALMPWSPVALGIGIAIYFALPVEPGIGVYAFAVAVVGMGIGLIAARREVLGPLGLALVLVAGGLIVAGARAHGVAAPVLEFRYYGPIEGRIVGIDRSASDALRLTLDEVRLDDVSPARTPARVRVALHGDQGWFDPAPGARVMLTGHLSPPSGPAEPGGFDFQRHAWFLSLGAVGYTRTPVLLAEPRGEGAAPLFHLRVALSEVIRSRIDGQAGAFAAAVLTGDRSGLRAEPVAAMRDANIAHLLAISGLHMGLLTGFVYGALRLGLALIPALALRYPIRKGAAAAALGAGAFYLALSGGNVATERAFIQVGVMFCAVLLDRRAVTLRSVAIAAMTVLLHRPETLFSPGFQMSFAATTALVAVFNALRGATVLQGRPGWQKWIAALVISSLVAGLATAPFAAAHFNRISVYGLLANLLSVPVMGSLIIPAGVLAAILWPVGGADLAFAAMAPGLEWILGVAAWVAGLPGATEAVMSPPPGTLGVLTLGALFVILWRGPGRWIGVIPVLFSAFLWSTGTRPEVTVSDTGRLVGVWQDGARSLSRHRGDGFVAGIWLENDGDSATQAEAAARAGWEDALDGRVVAVGGVSIWHGPGQRGARAAAAACAAYDVIVVSEPLEALTPAPMAAVRLDPAPAMRTSWGAYAATGDGAACQVIDAELLRETGALSLSVAAEGITVDTARARQGDRLWTR